MTMTISFSSEAILEANKILWQVAKDSLTDLQVHVYLIQDIT